MSEETVVETEVVETPVDPDESTARESGWVSKDEWVAAGKNPDEHRSAKEFNRVGELYKSLHQVKREQKQLQAAHTALQRHQQYIFDKAYKKALDDFKLERRLAMREGDEVALEKIEQDIEDLNNEYANQKATIQQVQPTQSFPEMDAFVERNPWYVSDPELAMEADALGFVYINRYGTKDPKVVFDYVEKKMREKFPQKFGGKRAAPSPVANGDRTQRAPKNDIVLDELETKIMNDLVKSGEMTEAQYKADLKRAKGIK